MKNRIRKRILFVLGILVIILSLGFNTKVVEAVEVDQHNGYYYANGDEPAGFEAKVPQNAENSDINISDAFSLPGIYNSTDVYKRNNAYLSNERSNVLILYDGTTGSQKSSLWYRQQLNLNYPFEFEAYVYLSNKNMNGTLGIGDGITFTLQRDPALELAIGGTGGGISVFPNLRNSPNMIYNALAIEMDTYFNDDVNLFYDRQLKDLPWDLDASLAWPHLAMASTRTSGNLIENGSGAPTAYVFDHFKHEGVTNVSSADEQSAWFNKWIKLNVKWTPNGTAGDYANIESGNLEYTWGPIYDETGAIVQYTYNTQKWPDLNIDETFNSEPFNGVQWAVPWTKENRLVTWGFTGSNFLYGNPFGVMITKLPNEPDLKVDRTVRNTSVSGETASSYTQAKPGDVLEYTVRIANVSDDGTTIPLRNTKIVEDLQDNTWNNVFTYSNNLGAALTPPTPSVDGENNFTFTDTKNSIEPGKWFEYTYQVIVGADTAEFINDVEISSTYSTKDNFGETNVTVYPEGINLAKSVSDPNPKVGDTIEVSVDLTAVTGISVLETMKDSIPIGFELVPDSTKLTVYEGADKTKTKGSETLKDSLWTGSTSTGHTFDFEVDTDLTNSNLRDLVGGSIHNNLLSLTYKIKPTVALKGEKDISMGAADSSSTNKVNGIRGSLKYTATLAEPYPTVTVKTDLTFNFLDDQGQPLATDIIQSINPSFNEKNPVVFYLNTDDSYNYSSAIAEISGKLFADNQLSLYRVDTNSTSGSLTDISGSAVKDGTVIDLYYGSKAVLTIEFVDEAGNVMSGHTLTAGEAATNSIQTSIFIGSKIDLTSSTYQLVQDKVVALKKAGYATVTPPANETNIVMNHVTETVQYKVAGQLIISSYPKLIDFGELKYNGKAQRVDNPTIDEKLVIIDTHADTTEGYSVTAKMSSPMYNDQTQSTMSEAVRYVKGKDDEIILEEDAKEVYRESTGGTGIFTLTDTWGDTEGSVGLKLVADPNKTSKADVGVYTGEITWSINSAP